MSTSVRIVKTPDVLHGKPRVDGIRVSVLDIGDFAHRHGQSIEDVTPEFDVDRAQGGAALKYSEEHRKLMETSGPNTSPVAGRCGSRAACGSTAEPQRLIVQTVLCDDVRST